MGALPPDRVAGEDFIPGGERLVGGYQQRATFLAVADHLSKRGINLA